MHIYLGEYPSEKSKALETEDDESAFGNSANEEADVDDEDYVPSSRVRRRELGDVDLDIWCGDMAEVVETPLHERLGHR